MVLRYLVRYLRKKSGYKFTLFTKIYSKWIYYLKIQIKIIKVWDKSIFKMSWNGERLLKQYPRSKTHNVKTVRSDYMLV